jgi:long-chain acyl-CoA synthetase
MNLAELLTTSAQRHPQRPALKLDDEQLTYAELDDLTARAAGLLRERGVQPGDRVGVMLPNVLDFPVAYYGVLRAGGVVVPMNVLLKEREVAFYLGNPEAELVFAWHEFADDARAGAEQVDAGVVVVEPGAFRRSLAEVEPLSEVVPRDDDDTAVILYTSGTTGTPKGAELTHANLRRNVEVVRDVYGLDEQWVTLGALPLFHSFGQTCSLNVTMSVGACLTLIPRFNPGKALDIIERDRVTLFQGVPTMYSAMVNHPAGDRADTSSLINCVSGGASLPVEVLRAFEEKFNCKILEGYGLSETSPVASSNMPDRERKAGSIGVPIDGVEMRVVDRDDTDVAPGEVGEIVIRGHNVMKYYWNNPDATDEVMRGGWFHTGDLATMDEEGYFFIVDRKKDMIIRGGYNVYPREIEEVLYEHPAVREAAVVGVPHAELGEEVGAAVALREGTRATPEELQAFVKERVAAYKYPRHLWIVDDLPKGPTGKVLKREIRMPAELQV